MVKLTFTALALIAFLGAPPVFADLVAIGEPIAYESWLQEWSLTGFFFDRIEVEMLTPGVTFKGTGFKALDAEGDPIDFTSPWSTTNTGTVANLWNSSSADSVDFFLHYSPQFSNTTAFDYRFTAYNNDQVVQSYLLHWSKCQWSVTVPEAGTELHRAGWLLGMVALMVRRRRALTT